MPRLVFNSKDEFIKWVKEKVSSEKYDLYVTEDNEVILSPTKSTHPINYGFFKSSSDPKDIVKEIRESISGISVYFLKDFEWSTDRPPGIKMTVE